MEASLKPPEMGVERNGTEESTAVATEGEREERRVELLIRCRFFGIGLLLLLCGNIWGIWREKCLSFGYNFCFWRF